MKTILNAILFIVLLLLFYFLWNYMQVESTHRVGHSSTNSSSLNGSERIAIARYLQKSIKVASTDPKKNSSKGEEKREKVTLDKRAKEQNSTKKALGISIESILTKERNRTMDRSHKIKKLFIETLLHSEENKTVSHMNRDNNSNSVEKKVKNSNLLELESQKESDDNYTIKGIITIPKKSQAKKQKEVKKASASLAQKRLWLKAKKEPLNIALKRVGAKRGDPIFIRIFKESSELEVWIKPNNSNRYKLLKIYSICKYSGGLGPKMMQGDKKSPEGFYRVDYSALNPKSRFHLSFNLGFPNQYDRYHGYTGSYLMVHGKCASIGCYAMGDRNIDDIYKLVESALINGQLSVAVHIFPFRMTQINLAKHKKSPWYKFWLNLKEGYDSFEKSHRVPTIDVVNGHYKVVKGRRIL